MAPCTVNSWNCAVFVLQAGWAHTEEGGFTSHVGGHADTGGCTSHGGGGTRGKAVLFYRPRGARGGTWFYRPKGEGRHAEEGGFTSRGGGDAHGGIQF